MDWLNYFFHLNFLAHYDELEALPVGPLNEGQMTALISILSDVDTGEGKHLWNKTDATTQWGLIAASVRYNGMNMYSFPTKGIVENVLILDIEETVSTPAHAIYLTYSNKVNETAPVSGNQQTTQSSEVGGVNDGANSQPMNTSEPTDTTDETDTSSDTTSTGE